MTKLKKGKFFLLAFLLTVGLCGCGLKASNRKYADALDAYEAAEYDQAAELFTQAIEKNPDKAEFYIDYGFTLIQLGNYEEAQKQFDRVISDKEIEMVQENNKKALRGLGIVAYCSGQYEQALQYFEQALEISQLPELNLDLLSYQSSSLEMLGKLEEALKVYEKLSEQGTETAGLYRTRGNLYRKQGEYEKSLADYEKALSLAAEDFGIYLGKFAVLKELGREAEAIEVLSKADKLPVNSDADLFDLAQVHYYQGNITSAELEFLQVLDKGFVQAQYFLGELSLEDGNYEEARQSFEAYLATGRPGTAAMYNQLLVCCLHLKDLDAAKIYLEKAKELSDATIRQALARNEVTYLEYSGAFEEAFEKLERYLVIYPEDEQAQQDMIFLKTRVPETTQDKETGKE